MEDAAAEALRYSEDLSVWIETHHPTELPGSPTTMVAGPYFAICLDHRAAILLLVANGARSSACALARPVYEAYMRGLWAKDCATAEDIEAIRATRVLPKFDTMIRALDRIAASNGTFGATKKIAWGPLSDLTHGGFQQLTHWATDEDIGPSYSDREIASILWMADLYGILACMGMAAIAGASVDTFVMKANEHLAEGKRRQDA